MMYLAHIHIFFSFLCTKFHTMDPYYATSTMVIIFFVQYVITFMITKKVKTTQFIRIQSTTCYINLATWDD